MILEKRDAETIKGMLKRGDKQHDIAAFCGVNQGRIAEIAAGEKFDEAEAAETSLLPPPGPYHVREFLLLTQRVIARYGEDKLRGILLRLLDES